MSAINMLRIKTETTFVLLPRATQIFLMQYNLGFLAWFFIGAMFYLCGRIKMTSLHRIRVWRQMNDRLKSMRLLDVAFVFMIVPVASASTHDLMITGVMDATLTGGAPKVVE